MKRSAGVLMHISSLPNKYGIGKLGKEAYEFIDFLEEVGQSYWQILPLSPTAYGDSPYQGVSSFAGNPYFISFEKLEEKELLKEEDYKAINWGNEEAVDYGLLFNEVIKVLKKSYLNMTDEIKEKKELFKSKNSYWLNDYSLYMSVKEKYNYIPWYEWDVELKGRNINVLDQLRADLEEEIEFWNYTQYIFYSQWKELKAYANKKGIKIIGDLPIYCGFDSVDVWANQELFLIDEEWNPKKVSGYPPDVFSPKGQLWGNPIYNWDAIKGDGYNWWINRIKGTLNYFDVIRLDHFLGYEKYWQIDYGNEDGSQGQWVDGPGVEFFDIVKSNFSNINIILEDLGNITSEAIELREYLKYPGMNVLEFAFNPNGDSIYLPYKYRRNSVVYTGTHDNNTIKGWISEGNQDEVNFAMQYLNVQKKEELVYKIIRCAYESVSDLAIIPIQDFLEEDSKGRMNIPSTLGGNWCYRVDKEYRNKITEKIKKIVKIYGR